MNLKNLSLIALSLVLVSSCSKQEQKVNTDGQSSTQNVVPNSNSQKEIINKWTGRYTFDESAPNAAGSGAQSWSYTINVSVKEGDSLFAIIQVDGFQTMTRIEADVRGTDKNADFIFSKYGEENMFELFKKGEKLFSLEINEKNEMITNWDKMKPNVVDNQKSGKVMFKKVIS